MEFVILNSSSKFRILWDTNSGQLTYYKEPEGLKSRGGGGMRTRVIIPRPTQIFALIICLCKDK